MGTKSAGGVVGPGIVSWPLTLPFWSAVNVPETLTVLDEVRLLEACGLLDPRLTQNQFEVTVAVAVMVSTEPAARTASLKLRTRS